MGFGKEGFQLLNRRITEDSIPYPVYSSYQYTIDLAKIGFQSIFSSIKLEMCMVLNS